MPNNWKEGSENIGSPTLLPPGIGIYKGNVLRRGAVIQYMLVHRHSTFMIKRLFIMVGVISSTSLKASPWSFALSSSGLRNPQKFSPRRSLLCDNYKRFSNGDHKMETQNDVFSPGKPPPKISPERFHNRDNEDEFQVG